MNLGEVHLTIWSPLGFCRKADRPVLENREGYFYKCCSLYKNVAAHKIQCKNRSGKQKAKMQAAIFPIFLFQFLQK